MSQKPILSNTNFTSSLGPTNGPLAVGDGAHFSSNPQLRAVCHVQGVDDPYYYSTTFSGDRGSLGCVTGSPAFKSAPISLPSSRSIPVNTPPLTPDDGSDCSPLLQPHRPKDALDFLVTLFPNQGLSALTYASRVSIASAPMGASFEGVVLDLPGKPKTLYVDGKSADALNLRESIVALLELADQSLHCSALVIILERASPKLNNILHALMYVGGNVVTKPPFQVNPAFVLVGMEI